MRKAYHLLIASILVFGLASCNKGGQKLSPSPGSRSMLIGKWTLNKQKTVQYIDGTMQTDTLYLSTDTNYSYVQFNESNKYTSVSFFGTFTRLTSVISVDSAKGTFNFSNAKFSLSGGLTGLGKQLSFFTTGPPPVISLVSKTEQVNVLNSSSLTLHTELITTETTAAATKTYKSVNDLYYSK